MDVISLAKDSLKRHEGFRQFAYKCTAGRTTVGYGRNVDDQGITLREAEYLLDSDIVACLQDLSTFKWWNNLTPHAQAALIDLRFNLGAAGFRTFAHMIQCIERGDMAGAAYEILHSRYHDQVGTRAVDLAGWLAQ